MTPQAQLAPPRDAARVSAPAPRALRVCHVMSADLWAGAEVQLATTAAYLARQPGIILTAVLFNDGPLGDRLRQLGIPVTILDETKMSALGIVKRLTRFFRDHEIDLVHAHRYKDSVLATIAGKLAGVPHIVRTVHGLREPMTGWARLKFRIYEALDRMTLLCFADLVIAVSMRMADMLRASGYRPTSLTCIHNGIDLEAIVPGRPADVVRRELGIDPRAIVIGSAGRLAPVKGHASLLRAARVILDHRPDARVLIVGAGPLHAELLAQASRLGIAGACVFTGARNDAHELIAAMDVFVLPSLAEGIPMALLEAMALGKPVIATAVGGVPEVIQDRVNGMLVAPGDAQALADACLHAITDREWSSIAGVRARRLVEERFSHEGSGRALLAAYRSVALIPRLGKSYMGGRRHIEASTAHAGAAGVNEHPDRHLSPTQRPDGATLRVVPGTRKRVAAESPASSNGPSARPAFGSRIPDPASRPIGPLHLCGGLASAAVERASRKVAHWVARRAMCRLRRHPAPVAARLRSARRVLMVCHGNIIRSPFAAHVVERAVDSRSVVAVASAGLDAVPGKPAHPKAVQLAGARQIDLACHAAKPLTPELVAQSDLIFVMDIPQLVTLRRRFPEAGTRTFLLTCLAPDTPLEVADPVDGDDAVFGGCFEHITRATRPLIRAFAPPVH